MSSEQHNYFFETLETQTSASSSLWNVPNPLPTGKIMFSGPLLKHVKSSSGVDCLAERFFMLQDEYLMYKNSESSESISSGMKIKYAKLVVMPPAQPGAATTENKALSQYPLKICYKNKFTIFYAKSESDHKAWIEALTSVMTRSDIHDRFDITSEIGQGAFAHVFKAKEKASGQLYAIKGFNKEAILESDSGKQSLWNEIEIMRRLKGHPNVIQLHEVHDTKNSVYLIMDYLKGSDLEQLIANKRRLPEDTITKISQGMLRGLKTMESLQIFHRDIKPANVMLKKTVDINPEDVIFVDFGLAATAFDQDPVFKRCGTPGYIAPEVIAMKNEETAYKVPPKCDLFSTGVVLHMLCTGKSLFDRPEFSEGKVLRLNLKSRVDFPEGIFRTFKLQFIALLKRLLEADPAKRISVDEALQLDIFVAAIEESFDSSIEDSFEKEFLSPKLKHQDKTPAIKEFFMDSNSSFLSAAKERKNVYRGVAIYTKAPQMENTSRGGQIAHLFQVPQPQPNNSPRANRGNNKHSIENPLTQASPVELRRSIPHNQTPVLHSYLHFPVGHYNAF